jgi:dual specificity protein phosphatase-like protein
MSESRAPVGDILAQPRMENLFWLIPARLAGRPGPDRALWSLASLRDAGIGAVLSVNDGLLCHPEDFKAYGISYACIPLSENAPPQPGDNEICLRALPVAYTFVQQQIRQGRATVVHCSSGKDRTGLFLAYYLMRETGLSVAAAIEELRRVRPNALSAAGWHEFAIDVLSRCP